MGFWLKLMLTGCTIMFASFVGLVLNDSGNDTIDDICACTLVGAGIVVLVAAIMGIWVEL